MVVVWTQKKRAIAALEGKQPDRVPTFELEFQLTEELFGRSFRRPSEASTDTEFREICRHNAALYVDVAKELEYDIIMLAVAGEDEAALLETGRHIKDLVGEQYLLVAHGDGTFAIPDGNTMLEFSYWLHDHPQEVHEHAKKMMNDAVERNKRLFDAGFDGFALCADYCFNDGPFMSPKMFSEFVTPYLAELIAAIRQMGAYAIKHTDGNIMPIVDQLVDCNPHALHSLDPMAGIDIKTIKETYGDRVCLIGNVNCALLQTGTPEEIDHSALYALTHGKPGGGYIYSTSNVAYKGMPLENYTRIWRIWKENRDY
jgi:uroporphyrinogen decarboxylase